MKVIQAEDFGLVPNTAEDSSLPLTRLLWDTARLKDACLTFQAGVYHFYAEHAAERYLFVSNNEHGLKRVVFPLLGCENLTVDGQGASFIFHGQMIPFVLERARDLTLKHFSVDWEQPLHAQGRVVEIGIDYVDIAVDPPAEFYMDRGVLTFCGEGWQAELSNVLEIDLATLAPMVRSGDNHCGGWWGERWDIRQSGPRRLRFKGTFSIPPTKGSGIVFQLRRRRSPGIFLKDSVNTTLEGVTLHHAGAMGLVAQKCEDICLRAFHVMPREGSGRLFSAGADASHFVYCRGQIELDGCRFENELDDPINVHGIYATIKKQLDDATLLIKLNHPEQVGVTIFDPGDEASFNRLDTLMPYANTRVRRLERINAAYSLLSIEQVPAGCCVGDVLENLSWAPDVVIRNCHFRRNRARGILVSTSGRVLIENNHISAAGAAVLIATDANSWFESGAVHDVTIRDNCFVDCLYGTESWGPATITIMPAMRQTLPAPLCLYENIRIENNRFEMNEAALVFARSVKSLVFKGNRYEPSRRQIRWRQGQQVGFVLEHCRDARLIENQLGDDPAVATVRCDKAGASALEMDLSMHLEEIEGI